MKTSTLAGFQNPKANLRRMRAMIDGAEVVTVEQILSEAYARRRPVAAKEDGRESIIRRIVPRSAQERGLLINNDNPESWWGSDYDNPSLKGHSLLHYLTDANTGPFVELPFAYNSVAAGIFRVPRNTVFDLANLVRRNGGADNLVPMRFELHSLLTADDTNTVENHERFSTDALNILNTLYYANPSVFDHVKSHLAGYFANAKDIHHAFAETLRRLPKDRPVRVLELCSGIDERWKSIASFLPDRQIQVLRTDFVLRDAPTVPSEGTQCTIRHAQYNILEPLPFVSKNKRFNAMMVTYGFDSVWGEDDKSYAKIKGIWHETRYRFRFPTAQDDSEIAFDPDGPVTLEALKKYVAGLDWETGRKFLEKCTYDIDYFPIDLEDVPYGRIIEKRYKHMQNVNVSSPGTAIKRIQEAFASCLDDDGIVIMGEVGYSAPVKKNGHMINKTGPIAVFHIDDFGIAAEALEQLGYEVEMVSHKAFIQSRTGKTQGIDDGNTVIMVVRKKQLSTGHTSDISSRIDPQQGGRISVDAHQSRRPSAAFGDAELQALKESDDRHSQAADSYRKKTLTRTDERIDPAFSQARQIDQRRRDPSDEVAKQLFVDANRLADDLYREGDEVARQLSGLGNPSEERHRQHRLTTKEITDAQSRVRYLQLQLTEASARERHELLEELADLRTLLMRQIQEF
ncbi:MAG: hypothetical protein WCP97_03990 [bacterium]